MKKKMFTMVMIMTMILSFAGCSNDSNDSDVKPNVETSTEEPSMFVIVEDNSAHYSVFYIKKIALFF